MGVSSLNATAWDTCLSSSIGSTCEPEAAHWRFAPIRRYDALRIRVRHSVTYRRMLTLSDERIILVLHQMSWSGSGATCHRVLRVSQ